MIPLPRQLRARLRTALSYLGRKQATVYRYDRDEHGGLLDTRTAIGRVAGYPYHKARQAPNIAIALPGQTNEDEDDANHLMVLYATNEDRPLTFGEYDPPDARKDDAVVMEDGTEYRLIAAVDVLGGTYQIYRVKAI